MKTTSHGNCTARTGRHALLTLVMALGLGFGHSRPADADQPHMQAALKALRRAETQLELASHDKGGHRARALELVREAIRETEAGIRYDRRH